MSADVDNAGILADIRRARCEFEPAIQRSHIFKQFKILRVDGIDRHKPPLTVKDGICDGVVVDLVLCRQLVIKISRRHVRIRLILQDAVNVVIDGYRRFRGLPDVARLRGRCAAGECVHGGTNRVNIPHIAGIRRKGRFPRTKQLVRMKILVALLLLPEDRLK